MPIHHTIGPNLTTAALTILSAVVDALSIAASSNDASNVSINVGELALGGGGVVAWHHRFQEGVYMALADLVTPVALLRSTGPTISDVVNVVISDQLIWQRLGFHH